MQVVGDSFYFEYYNPFRIEFEIQIYSHVGSKIGYSVSYHTYTIYTRMNKILIKKWQYNTQINQMKHI